MITATQASAAADHHLQRLGALSAFDEQQALQEAALPTEMPPRVTCKQLSRAKPINMLA